ncbi:MAG TPA: hypothetical protein VK683_03050 [Rhizomicrobium sp.]|jgi:hypothetical protein|nr:hypothetical protein [Rhizomicrobium sp.]
MGKLQRGLVFAALLSAMPATAQPASESAVGGFVDSHSTVTRLGKIARWEEGVCPNVTGLPANFAKFIAKRVRDVAAAAGAPVNANEGCKANIDIVFTTKPQGLLDSIRAKDPVLLGYFDNSSQADQMAMVTRIIQAWHATQTVDVRGHTLVDSRNNVSGGTAQSSNAQNSFGNRLGDGLHSSYYHAIIVADPSKLGDYEIGTLADHIAMLALAQPAAEETCADLPSILDMTSAQCHKDAPAKTLTTADTGYLRGLYQADPGTSLRTQKDGIAFRIKETLAGRM